MTDETEDAAPKAAIDWPDGEAGIELLCIELLRLPSLAEVMGWPPITNIHRQVRLGVTVSDVITKHADGSITLIEVKRDGLDMRDYCTGIGQLAYQAILALCHFQARAVRKVLAMPAPVPIDLILACECSGVDILPVVKVAEWRKLLKGADLV